MCLWLNDAFIEKKKKLPLSLKGKKEENDSNFVHTPVVNAWGGVSLLDVSERPASVSD